jgi:hypothetical protein
MTIPTAATRSEHGKPTITFSKLVDKLEQHYGAPAPPPSTDPLELIIWENIAYLAKLAKGFALDIPSHPDAATGRYNVVTTRTKFSFHGP